MEKITKKFEGTSCLADCLAEVNNMAKVAALVGDSKFPLSDLMYDTRSVVELYQNYMISHAVGTYARYYIGIRKLGCEGSESLKEVQMRLDCFGAALFFIKLDIGDGIIKMEVEVNI